MGDLGNFSRLTFDPKKHYVGVRLQQGVPLVDADWNEMEDIRRHEQRLVLKWLVGDGVPAGQDDAFSIHYILGTVMNPVLTDFVISNGLCLVDGWEVVNDLGQEENPLKYTDQRLYLLKDENGELAKAWQVPPLPLLTTVPAMTSTRSDLVYLDVWEREVNWQEDASLVNLQIGVPTCVRRKTEWVVRVREGLADPGELVETLQQDGVWREQHAYCPLAKLVRKILTMVIPQKETLSVEDLRRTGLAVLPGGITIKDGNIGIGTTAPKNKLDVEGAAVIGAAYAGSSGAPDNGLLVEGNVGIGTTTPSVKLEVAGALKATGPLTTTSDAYLATANGKVGIGTLEPQQSLSVAGALNVNQADANPGAVNPGITFGASSGEGIASKRTATGNSHGLDLYTASQPRLSITNGGYVGIGTSTPGATLSVIAGGANEIVGDAQSSTFRTSAGTLGVAQGSELSLASIGFLAHNNVSLGVRAVRLIAGGSDWQSTAIGLGIDVDNTKRAGGASLWLRPNGIVGIEQTLIVGTNVDAGIKVRSIDGKHWQNDTYDELHLNWKAQKPVVVGPGSASASTPLVVNGNISGYGLSISGNVGIGVTEPEVALHVGGEARINGSLSVSGASGEFVMLTNRAYDNEDEFCSQNLKLWMGDQFVSVAHPIAMDYEFAIGHTESELFLPGHDQPCKFSQDVLRHLGRHCESKRIPESGRLKTWLCGQLFCQRDRRRN